MKDFYTKVSFQKWSKTTLTSPHSIYFSFLELSFAFSHEEEKNARRRKILYNNWEDKVYDKIQQKICKKFERKYEDYNCIKNKLYEEYLEVAYCSTNFKEPNF